jgi:microcompartment protein CcmK/EutM
MFLGDVIGTVVTPEQIPDLAGRTQLLVRPLTPRGEPTAKTRIAIDNIGAGRGDRVLVLDEGNGGRQVLGLPKGAVKTVVVAIVDRIELEGAEVYDHRERPPLDRRPA